MSEDAPNATERALVINRFAVEEAMQNAIDNDYRSPASQHVTREQAEQAMGRVLRLAEYFLPQRSRQVGGALLGGYGDAHNPILASLLFEHDAERWELRVYVRGREAFGPIFTLPARTLLVARDTQPDPPFRAAGTDED